MNAAQAHMTGKILYCEACGKLIPPEDAEAEDFAIIGGAPVCPRCLEKSDPKRKELFDTARSTRLFSQVELLQKLGAARPPEQVYPPPGTEGQEYPTSTEIKLIREELSNEWEDGKPKPAKPAQPPEPAKPAAPVPETNVPESGDTTGNLPVLPRQTKLAIAGVLVFSLVLLVALMAFVLKPAQEVGGSASPTTPIPSVQAPVPTVQPLEIPKPAAGDDPVRQAGMVETLNEVVGYAPERDVLLKAIATVRELTRSPHEQVQAPAAATLARFLGILDAETRQAARDAAEGSRELADRQLYTLAAKRLTEAQAALPEASPWAQQTGRRQLQALAETLAAEKELAQIKAIQRIETLVAAGQTDAAREAAQALRAHPEPDFQTASEPLLKLLDKAEDIRRLNLKRMEEAGRVAWPGFFRNLDAALAAGDQARAEALCKPPADSVLRAGGIEQPVETLDAFFAETAAVKELYLAALRAAVGREGTFIALPEGMGAPRGTLKGIEGRSLLLQLDNRAEVKLPVERLAPLELERLCVHQKDLAPEKYRPALWTLVLARGQADGPPLRWLTEQYVSQKRALPEHWRRRFELEARHARHADLRTRLAGLKQSLDAGEELALRGHLAVLAPLAQEFPDSLSLADRELLAAAEKRAGAGKLKHLVFQNGLQPAPDYAGIQVDQINKYYRNEERTDPDVHEGLKVGSHNDLQRVLIRFDGLEAALAKGRIRRATLELYQTEAQKADGAVVALYKLKKAWRPNAGTWKNADQRKRLAWDKPGASGADDAADKPDAEVTFDAQKSLWRSWDVTVFVREVVEGKALNNGLLLRVARDEPKYHIRFYPDGDLDAKKDAVLRPRLVVELETQE